LVQAGVGLPVLHAIALVQDRVRRHSPARVTTADMTIALVARDYIKRYLGTAGAVIGLAVSRRGHCAEPPCSTIPRTGTTT
jgi:hypothetical protein